MRDIQANNASVAMYSVVAAIPRYVEEHGCWPTCWEDLWPGETDPWQSGYVSVEWSVSIDSVRETVRKSVSVADWQVDESMDVPRYLKFRKPRLSMDSAPEPYWNIQLLVMLALYGGHDNAEPPEPAPVAAN